MINPLTKPFLKCIVCMNIGEGNDLFFGGHSFVVIFIQGWISGSEGKNEKNETVVLQQRFKILIWNNFIRPGFCKILNWPGHIPFLSENFKF